MIDSTNPRILANHIKKLWAKVNGIVPGTVVEGNPSGSGFNTLLTKIKIGSHKYKLPADVTANPEGEATDALTKIGIGSGIFSVSGGSSGVNYSSDEVDTGLKWIDGSSIYQKTIHDAGGSSGSVSIAHSISNLDKVINCYGSCVDSNDNSIFALPKLEPSGHDVYVNYITSTNIVLYIGTAYSTRITDIDITILYTKSNT